MADDFPDPLRLGYNSSILLKGNFPMTTQSMSLLLLLFFNQICPDHQAYFWISLGVECILLLTLPPICLQHFPSKGSLYPLALPRPFFERNSPLPKFTILVCSNSHCLNKAMWQRVGSHFQNNIETSESFWDTERKNIKSHTYTCTLIFQFRRAMLKTLRENL